MLFKKHFWKIGKFFNVVVRGLAGQVWSEKLWNKGGPEVAQAAKIRPSPLSLSPALPPSRPANGFHLSFVVWTSVSWRNVRNPARTSWRYLSKNDIGVVMKIYKYLYPPNMKSNHQTTLKSDWLPFLLSFHPYLPPYLAFPACQVSSFADRIIWSDPVPADLIARPAQWENLQ